MPLLSKLVPDGFVPPDHLSQDAYLWLGGVLVVSPLVYYGLMAVYNIYFHPLSKYPGPKSWVATPFYYSMLQLRGTAPIETAKLHNKYGPIVRISAEELSVTYPGAWKDIYGHRKAGEAELSKDKRFFAGFKEPNLINSDREYHGYLRKLLSNGFSDSALRQQEGLVQQYLNTLMSRLHEKGGEGTVAVDLAHWYSYFTFDVIGYLTYGESFDCLKDSNLNAFLSNTLGFVMFLAVAQAAARLPSFVKLPFIFWKMPEDAKQKAVISEEILEAKVKSRLENPPPVPDFMGRLIDVFYKKEMTFNQLKDNSRLILFAGSETTATALAGITKLLLEYPEQYNKLATEIRTRFGSADEITMTSVNSCRYLLAVIEEGLRMYPPSATAHPRHVPSGGITLDDGKYFVPEDMLVGVTTYAMLHSQDNWVNPDKFAPERWLPEKGSRLLQGENDAEGYTRPEEYNADKKDSFQTFSFGPRNCIGRNLAYAEMKLVLARLLFEFDLEWDGPEHDNWFNQPVFMIWVKKPLKIKLHPRQKA